MKALELRKNEIKIIELDTSHKGKKFEKWKKKLDKDIIKQCAIIRGENEGRIYRRECDK